MADFTMELREVMQFYDIGLVDYPIFDEDYRPILNQRIIDEFLFQEIGYESCEMFIHQLNHKMRLNMPVFNKLYESTLLTIDPLRTMNIKTVSESLRNTEAETKRLQESIQSALGTATSKSSTESKSRAVNSQFPQQLLAANADYASAAADNVGESEVESNSSDKTDSTGESSSSGTDKETARGSSETTMSGFSGSQSDLLLRYRETFINVDSGVIEMLNPLFMQVASIPDSYTPRPMFPVLGYNGLGYGRY